MSRGLHPANHQVDQFIDDAFEFYKLKKGEETDKSTTAVGSIRFLFGSCLVHQHVLPHLGVAL